MEEGTAIGQQLPFLDQRSKGRGRPSSTNLMMTGFIRTRITLHKKSNNFDFIITSDKLLQFTAEPAL